MSQIPENMRLFFEILQIPSFYIKEQLPKRIFGIRFGFIYILSPPKRAELVLPMVKAKTFFLFLFGFCF